jgi:cytoskeletal protein CcmA (bactofilin family)
MRKFRRILYLKLARLIRGEKNIVPCIISAGTKITGNIIDGDVIHIDGKLEGDIACNDLVIGATGSVRGNVRARNLEIYGELNGSLKAESLFIAQTAKFFGDANYKTIAIEPGAVLVGQCNRTEDKKANDKVIDIAEVQA